MLREEVWKGGWKWRRIHQIGWLKNKPENGMEGNRNERRIWKDNLKIGMSLKWE